MLSFATPVQIRAERSLSVAPFHFDAVQPLCESMLFQRQSYRVLAFAPPLKAHHSLAPAYPSDRCVAVANRCDSHLGNALSFRFRSMHCSLRFPPDPCCRNSPHTATLLCLCNDSRPKALPAQCESVHLWSVPCVRYAFPSHRFIAVS